MSYQVIARKWRSQSFDQLVGQNHIGTTLQNALSNDRLPHALLFTGPRGTGKTSSARILAKALRCTEAVNFNPCNVCNECTEIALSRSPNVLEIDGASNNGVDAIRELRETAQYAPSSGKYKIYIIDEVHMLSTSAFNALLKTLEEPPSHVIFILATTEVQKIPQTILSRCQRFDFRRIPTRLIADHLQWICQQEGIAADPESLWVIARQGDGSMRDAQSLLDQVITFANGDLQRSIVVEILGLTDHSLLLETLTSLVERQALPLLQILQRLSLSGCEPAIFAQDLLENIRHLLLVKISGHLPTASELIELPDSEFRALQDLGQKCSEEDLQLLFDMMLKAAADIHRASNPRVVLDMVLLRMVSAPRAVDLQQFMQGLQQQASLEGLEVPASPLRASPPAVASSLPMAAPATPTPAKPASLDLNRTLGLSDREKWLDLVRVVKSRDSLLGAKIEQLLFLKNKDQDKVIELAVPQKMAFLQDQLRERGSQEKLQSLIDQQWGPGYKMQITLSSDSSGVSAVVVEQEKHAKKLQNMADAVAAHPRVQAANSIFKGQITAIKEHT